MNDTTVRNPDDRRRNRGTCDRYPGLAAYARSAGLVRRSVSLGAAPKRTGTADRMAQAEAAFLLFQRVALAKRNQKHGSQAVAFLYGGLTTACILAAGLLVVHSAMLRVSAQSPVYADPPVATAIASTQAREKPKAVPRENKAHAADAALCRSVAQPRRERRDVSHYRMSGKVCEKRPDKIASPPPTPLASGPPTAHETIVARCAL